MEMASSSNSNSKDMISAWNLVFSSLSAMALKCALLLKIPDIISTAGRGPEAIAALSISQIAAHMEKPPDLDSLSRIVRYLSNIGVFSEMEINGEIVYGLTEMTKTYFVREGNPANLAAYHLFFNDEVSQAAWHCLRESAVEGRNAFQIAHGGRDLWDYANHDARYNRLLNDGMLSQTSVLIKDILADYDGFKDVTTLVDVGGGVGGALTEIMAVHQHIQGINFDLPHVVANAPHIRGIEHIAGNMFESIPSGDALFLKGATAKRGGRLDIVRNRARVRFARDRFGLPTTSSSAAAGLQYDVVANLSCRSGDLVWVCASPGIATGEGVWV